MPRRPVPCRECGKPCNVGKGSLPQPTCLACRRSRPGYRDSYRIPCSGCGKEIHRNGTETPTCLDCIRKRPGYRGRWKPAQPFEIACAICGQTAATVQPDQKTCLDVDCRRKFTRIKAKERQRRYIATDRFMDTQKPSCRIWIANCAECGKLFVARAANQLRCGMECHRKAHSRIASDRIMRRYREDPAFRDLVISKAQNRRASRLGREGITSPAALIAYLMDRGHGRCGKCHQPIKAKTGPRRPSIGHIIPLARGGEHVLENVQAEHLDCNLRAGARDHGGQTLLVG